MYYFEGKDYSKLPTADDHKSFARLMEEQQAELKRIVGEGRALRGKTGVSLSPLLSTEGEVHILKLKTLNLFSR